MLLNLTADLAGQAAGNLLDPLLWAIMVVAALRLRMRWLVPMAVVAALLIEAMLYLGEPPELQGSRFSGNHLIGRFLAGAVIGVIVRAVVVMRANRQVPPSAATLSQDP